MILPPAAVAVLRLCRDTFYIESSVDHAMLTQLLDDLNCRELRDVVDFLAVVVVALVEEPLGVEFDAWLQRLGLEAAGVRQ